MKTYFKFILIFNVFLFGACASKTKSVEQETQKEVTSQPVRGMHGEVASRGLYSILNSQTLNDEQKKQLVELHGDMTKEIFKIQDETSQLKSVLFEAIATKPYDSARVKYLRKRLVALNDQKMTKMFDAIDKVKVILGEQKEASNPDFYRPFYWEPHHPGQTQ